MGVDVLVGEDFGVIYFVMRVGGAFLANTEYSVLQQQNTCKQNSAFWLLSLGTISHD